LLTEQTLLDILHRSKPTNKDGLLLCLAVDSNKPKKVKEINQVASNVGYRSVAKLNISSYLSNSQGLAILTPLGWKLSPIGVEHVHKLIQESGVDSVKAVISASLRSHLSKISNPLISKFVEEAIECYERKLLRAAVVLSWVGAVSLLYEFILANRLDDFNIEASRRDNKWKNAKTRDDLAKMKEGDFLDVLESLSILGKSVKLELKKCLDLRNGAGHPNSLQIGENMVSAHIETLILNVFSVFSV